MQDERFPPDDDFGGMFDDEDLEPETQEDIETDKLEEEGLFEEEEAGEEEGAAANRTFMMLAIALGALVLLSLCGIGTWALFLRPKQASRLNTQATSIMLTNTALAATNTAVAQTTQPGPIGTPPPGGEGAGAAGGQQPTASPTPMSPTPTPMSPPTVTPTPLLPTPTPVVFQASPTPVVQLQGTPTPLINPTSIAATATAIALAAIATQQAISGGALPDTGLGDTLFTSPLGLLALAVLLVLIIVFARQARRRA